MRKSFALFIGLVVCYSGVASAQVREEWVARYDGPVNENDSSSDIAVDAQAELLYVTGPNAAEVWDGVGCIDYDWATLKYDADGNKLWVRLVQRLDVSTGATRVAVDGAGSVYVTGKVCVAESWDELGGYCFDSDYTTIKDDRDRKRTLGRSLWRSGHRFGHGAGRNRPRMPQAMCM